MRVVMMSSALLVFLPAWYLARPLGNHALWLAFMLFMAARGVGIHFWFRRMVTRGIVAAA
jgi:MATE family multidrug resistance protein